MQHIHKATVIGAGVMGASIAPQFPNAGVPVLLLEISPDRALHRNGPADQPSEAKAETLGKCENGTSGKSMVKSQDRPKFKINRVAVKRVQITVHKKTYHMLTDENTHAVMCKPLGLLTSGILAMTNLVG